MAPGQPVIPHSLVTTTMRPLPLARMCGSTACTRWKVPPRWCQRPSTSPPGRAPGRAPWSCRRGSRRARRALPAASATAETSERTCPGSLTSPARCRRSRRPGRAGVRVVQVVDRDDRALVGQPPGVRAPMPWAAPVTRATRPARGRGEWGSVAIQITAPALTLRDLADAERPLVDEEGDAQGDLLGSDEPPQRQRGEVVGGAPRESGPIRGVSVGPGATALTRTPRGATSAARLRTRPRIAPLAAA